MAKSINATLGETEYTIPHLNLGQIEDLMELWGEDSSPTAAVSFKKARLAAGIILRRATPAVEDVSLIECEPDQLRDMTTRVMVLSGLQPKADGVGEAKPAGMKSR